MNRSEIWKVTSVWMRSLVIAHTAMTRSRIAISYVNVGAYGDSLMDVGAEE